MIKSTPRRYCSRCSVYQHRFVRVPNTLYSAWLNLWPRQRDSWIDQAFATLPIASAKQLVCRGLSAFLIPTKWKTHPEIMEAKKMGWFLFVLTTYFIVPSKSQACLVTTFGSEKRLGQVALAPRSASCKHRRNAGTHHRTGSWKAWPLQPFCTTC